MPLNRNGWTGALCVGVTLSFTAAVACSSGDGSTDPSNVSCNIPASVPSGAVVVRIKDFTFIPADVNVKSGDQVAWVNCGVAGDESHTSTSDTGVWDSQTIAPGGAFVRSFTGAAGTALGYHCIPHPFMKGTVNITS